MRALRWLLAGALVALLAGFVLLLGAWLFMPPLLKARMPAKKEYRLQREYAIERPEGMTGSPGRAEEGQPSP